MEALPVFLNLRGRPVILIGAGVAAEAKRRLLARAGAAIVGEDDPDARVAIVVDDDAAVARLRARGVLVNATDRPALCDFTLPAIVDRAPVLVAIGTGGASAGLAKALRGRIEALLPARLGGLARGLHAARDAIRARWPDADARRRAIDAALAEGGSLDPLADAPPARDAGGDDARIAGWIGAAGDGDDGDDASRLERVVLASDDPDALTLRAARLLARADRVYHRADVPRAILDRARADADRIVADAPPADPGAGLSVYLA